MCNVLFTPRADVCHKHIHLFTLFFFVKKYGVFDYLCFICLEITHRPISFFSKFSSILSKKVIILQYIVLLLFYCFKAITICIVLQFFVYAVGMSRPFVCNSFLCFVRTVFWSLLLLPKMVMMTRPFSPDRLKKLSLSNTQVSDSGLQGLISLKELQELCLDRTAVTSRGVAALITHLPHLQVQ